MVFSAHSERGVKMQSAAEVMLQLRLTYAYRAEGWRG
jgi:hypothetical protein